jgi:hypothetical protein
MTPLYLSFLDEAQATSVLYTTTPAVLDEDGTIIAEETITPNYMNIDTIGIVYEPAPDLEDYVPVPYPVPNWGVNVLVLDGENAEPLQAYAVQPSPFPQRVWAI